ncbi:MAG: DoxX family protein [Rikenellaceae bacterium]
MKRILFSALPLQYCGLSFVSFMLRIIISGAILTHGIPKIMSFDVLSYTFADPIGLGSATSLTLTIIAEVGCSILVLFGLFTRLALIPLILNMATLIFVVQMNAPFESKELALLYMIIYIAIYAIGGGEYSLDRVIFKHRKTKMCPTEKTARHILKSV